MKGYLGSLAFVAVFLGLATSIGFASATNIYIAQNPVGSANGADCADAFGVNFFNASGDWGAGTGQIGPGTTVHLCGTFTGGPGSTMLTAQGSGASGSPITIKFESGTILTAPYWSGSTGAINLNGKSYITVDGGTDGIIQATANGTGLAYQTRSVGIRAVGTTNCEIKNLTISDMYVHTSPSDSSAPENGINAVLYYPPATNLTLDNNVVHDCGLCFNGYGNGVVVHNNDIYNFANAVTMGVSESTYGTISNMSIYNNHFHDMANWDTTSNAYHKEAMHIWGENGGLVDGVQIYNNTFDGTIGANNTAWVFLEENCSNIRVYNNVFVTPSGTHAYNGQLDFEGRSGDTNVDNNSAYNNVFIDHNPTVASTRGVQVHYNTNFSFKNNIIEGASTNITIANSTVSDISNNVYENVATDYGSGQAFLWNNTYTTTLSGWQSLCGCDENSLLAPASQINLAVDGTLNAGSIAIGAGANLTSLGITVLDYDKLGVQRPSSGSWDAGAYVYGSGSSGPPPPSGLTAAAH